MQDLAEAALTLEFYPAVLGTTSAVGGTVNSGGVQLLRAIVVVIPLLLVIAGDVETNPGPEGVYFV